MLTDLKIDMQICSLLATFVIASIRLVCIDIGLYRCVGYLLIYIRVNVLAIVMRMLMLVWVAKLNVASLSSGVLGRPLIRVPVAWVVRRLSVLPMGTLNLGLWAWFRLATMVRFGRTMRRNLATVMVLVVYCGGW